MKLEVQLVVRPCVTVFVLITVLVMLVEAR